MNIKVIHSKTCPSFCTQTLWIEEGFWPDISYLQLVINKRGGNQSLDFAPMVTGAHQVMDGSFRPIEAIGKWEYSLGAAKARYFGLVDSPAELHAAVFWEHPPLVLKPALFLDRDGIVNTDHGYVFKFKDVEWVPGIVELIQSANQLGLYVFIITNQGGVAYGHYKEEDVLRLHRKMHQHLLERGAFIDGWAYAPTHAKKGSGKYCMESLKRKPYPGMMLELASRFGVDLTRSIMIGDKPSDHLYLEGPEYMHLQGDYDLSLARTQVYHHHSDIHSRLQEKFS